jgi:hypothetical protein
MDDQRTDRADGGGMSRENERRRMEAILMSFVGAFFIFAGALTLWNGAPADGVFMFLFGVTSFLMGIRNYRRIGTD